MGDTGLTGPGSLQALGYRSIWVMEGASATGMLPPPPHPEADASVVRGGDRARTVPGRPRDPGVSVHFRRGLCTFCCLRSHSKVFRKEWAAPRASGLPSSQSGRCCPSRREARWLLVTGDRFWVQVEVSFSESMARAVEFASIPRPGSTVFLPFTVLHTGPPLSGRNLSINFLWILGDAFSIQETECNTFFFLLPFS